MGSKGEGELYIHNIIVIIIAAFNGSCLLLLLFLLAVKTFILFAGYIVVGHAELSLTWLVGWTKRTFG